MKERSIVIRAESTERGYVRVSEKFSGLTIETGNNGALLYNTELDELIDAIQTLRPEKEKAK